MGIWTVIKRLDKRSDDWSRPAIERMIANIDSHSSLSLKKHIGVRDLITHALKPAQSARHYS